MGHIRGIYASASLKLLGVFLPRLPVLAHIRGIYASASLKLQLPPRLPGEGGDIRGIYASASLKHALMDALDPSQYNISEAFTPRPH